MSQSTTTNVLVQIVELLTPLASDERKRVVQSALTFLGDTPLAAAPAPGPADEGSSSSLDAPFLPKVNAWIRQMEISPDELQQVFHVEGGTAEMIASNVPGKNNKEKTLNAYVLTGATAFLTAGTPNFDDKAARAMCKHLGCHDESNHALYIKNKGNEFTGTKEKGWTLTSPGLKRAATLIKEMTKAA